MQIPLAAAVILLTVAMLPAADPDLNDLLRLGKTNEAVAQLKKEIAAHPNDTESNVRLVEILIDAERFDEADDVIKTALGSNAQASDLHRVHGDLLYREGHILEADTEYKAGYKLDKQNARAMFGISRTFRVAGLRAKAATLIRAAHSLDPSDEEIAGAADALDDSVARWQKALLNPLNTADPQRKQRLENQLAQAKILNGRHPLEVASPYQPYLIPYRVLYNGKRPTGIGLTISINGVKSELRVDTGAGGVAVSSGFAAKAGIQRVGSSKIGGIGNKGDVASWIGYAEHMQIGDLVFNNVIVDVKEKGSLDDSGGLLGTDIFKRFLVKLNFHDGRIDLDPLPGPAWDGYTPVDRYDGPEVKKFSQIFQVHHYLLIPTLVSEKEKSDQTNCLFLIDTGAGFSNISTNLAPSVTKVHNNDYVEIRGVAGKVKMVYQADRVVLQFASFRQTNLDLTSLDLSNISRSAGLEIGGILGLPVLALFNSFTIDYRDARIDFDYKPR